MQYGKFSDQDGFMVVKSIAIISCFGAVMRKAKTK
jgi:hypothetical protein